MRTAVSVSFRRVCAQMSVVKASHYHDVTFLSQLKHKELHILALLCRRGRVQQTQRLQSQQQQNQASFDSANQWKAYGKQISAGLTERDDPEVFAEDEIKS